MKKERRGMHLIVASDRSRRLRRGQTILIFLMIALFVSHLCSEPSYGATYYVSLGGSDSNQGTESQPWLTIQKAADTLVAGDTVYIKAGTYNEAVFTQNSGNAGNYITYAANPGDTVIIDGTGVDANNGFIVDKTYIKLSGLEICNWNEAGVWAENAGYLEISDCVVHNVIYAIGVADGTHDFVLNRVEMHHFDGYGFDASPTGGADCYNGTFNDGIAHTARDPEQNVDGFALGHGTQHDFVFNRCVTYDVYDGFDISSRNTTLNRCLAYNCWNGGYKLWQDNITLVNCIGYNAGSANVELDWDGNPRTSTLLNCTFVDGGLYNVWVENSGDSLHMYNCILAGGDNIGLAFEQMGVHNYQGDYNLFHNDLADRAIAVAYTDEFLLSQIESGAWTTYSGQDANSLVAYTDTEIFVNPTGFDLHLLPTSPAIDKGTNAGAPSEDYDGNVRPHGSGYDIGAYEYGAATATTTIGPTTTSTAGPITTTTVESSTTTTKRCCPSQEIYREGSEELELLRSLRDNLLSQSPEGREIIRLYYMWSPVVVEAIQGDEKFKEDIKGVIEGLLMLITEEAE
jgi:hypothetical protein